MIDLLDTLHRCAVDLRRVGMMQSAGDYDYLVAWLRSPEFNNGEHLKPHPAGENTIDEYSNSCPIPFTPNRQMISYCTDNDIAEQLIQSTRNIITELLNVYTDDIEKTVLSTYLEYSDKIIALLSALLPEPPNPPDQPSPPKPPYIPIHSIGGAMAITSEGVSSAIYAASYIIEVMQKDVLTQSIVMKSFNGYAIGEGGVMQID